MKKNVRVKMVLNYLYLTNGFRQYIIKYYQMYRGKQNSLLWFIEHIFKICKYIHDFILNNKDVKYIFYTINVYIITLFIKTKEIYIFSNSNIINEYHLFMWFAVNW